MKLRYRILVVVILAAAVLIAVRVRRIVHVPLRSEAVETRMQLEAMAEQDVDAIREEIDLRRSVLEAAAGGDNASPGAEGDSADSGTGEDEVNSDRTAGSEDAGEETPSLEELQNFNYQEIFERAVLLGDSILEALGGADILSGEEYFISAGVDIELSVSSLYAAAERNPEVMFLTFGLDDLERYGEDVASFREDYDEFLYYVEDLLPNTRIYAALILPVQNSAVETNPSYAYRDDYNLAIESCCSEHGISWLDLDNAFSDDYYAPDGVHPLVYFYYGWLYHMAKGAGLL